MVKTLDFNRGKDSSFFKIFGFKVQTKLIKVLEEKRIRLERVSDCNYF